MTTPVRFCIPSFVDHGGSIMACSVHTVAGLPICASTDARAVSAGPRRMATGPTSPWTRSRCSLFRYEHGFPKPGLWQTVASPQWYDPLPSQTCAERFHTVTFATQRGPEDVDSRPADPSPPLCTSYSAYCGTTCRAPAFRRRTHARRWAKPPGRSASARPCEQTLAPFKSCLCDLGHCRAPTSPGRGDTRSLGAFCIAQRDTEKRV